MYEFSQFYFENRFQVIVQMFERDRGFTGKSRHSSPRQIGLEPARRELPPLVGQPALCQPFELSGMLALTNWFATNASG
jgi:hypothetical protein